MAEVWLAEGGVHDTEGVDQKNDTTQSQLGGEWPAVARWHPRLECVQRPCDWCTANADARRQSYSCRGTEDSVSGHRVQVDAHQHLVWRKRLRRGERRRHDVAQAG